MTPDELRAKGFTEVSPGWWEKHPAVRPRPVAVVESNPRPEPLATRQVQKEAGGRFLVRVTSRRRRLLDEDNLCEKYIVDCCRFAGFLPTDAPDAVKIEVGQVKVGRGEPEETIVEIEREI